jgi:hypothetical protein
LQQQPKHRLFTRLSHRNFCNDFLSIDCISFLEKDTLYLVYLISYFPFFF